MTANSLSPSRPIAPDVKSGNIVIVRDDVKAKIGDEFTIPIESFKQAHPVAFNIGDAIANGAPSLFSLQTLSNLGVGAAISKFAPAICAGTLTVIGKGQLKPFCPPALKALGISAAILPVTFSLGGLTGSTLIGNLDAQKAYARSTGNNVVDAGAAFAISGGLNALSNSTAFKAGYIRIRVFFMNESNLAAVVVPQPGVPAQLNQTLNVSTGPSNLNLFTNTTTLTNPIGLQSATSGTVSPFTGPFAKPTKIKIPGLDWRQVPVHLLPSNSPRGRSNPGFMPANRLPFALQTTAPEGPPKLQALPNKPYSPRHPSPAPEPKHRPHRGSQQAAPGSNYNAMDSQLSALKREGKHVEHLRELSIRLYQLINEGNAWDARRLLNSQIGRTPITEEWSNLDQTTQHYVIHSFRNLINSAANKQAQTRLHLALDLVDRFKLPEAELAVTKDAVLNAIRVQFGTRTAINDHYDHAEGSISVPILFSNIYKKWGITAEDLTRSETTKELIAAVTRRLNITPDVEGKMAYHDNTPGISSHENSLAIRVDNAAKLIEAGKASGFLTDDDLSKGSKTFERARQAISELLYSSIGEVPDRRIWRHVERNFQAAKRLADSFGHSDKEFRDLAAAADSSLRMKAKSLSPGEADQMRSIADILDMAFNLTVLHPPAPRPNFSPSK